MADNFHLTCGDCGADQPDAYASGCNVCGGLIEARFDLDRVKLRDSDDPHQRYFDLIPVRDEMLMAPGVRTRSVHARNLGQRYGLNNLYLKDETENPTGTTKDRMAAVALPFLYEGGVRHFCASSTGNSSTGYAQAIGQIPAMKMELFTAEDFKDRVNYAPTEQIRHHVLREASFVDAGDFSTAFAETHGFTAERGFFNLGRREGLKLPWLEALEQVSRRIDYYVQAVSSAMGVHGVHKAAKEALHLGLADKVPSLLCAQQMSCRPMVQAWDEDSPTILPHHIVKRPHGIAEAILRGNPSRVYPMIRAIVIETGGTMVAVDDDEIRAAQAHLLEDEGIAICPAAGTAVAAIAKLAKTDGSLVDQTILVNLTGSTREGATPAPVDHLWERDGDQWVPAGDSAEPLRTGAA
ncbi:MAG: pyridoxal-phosphate dependent enzyme [Sphingomicrobium sp.]